LDKTEKTHDDGGEDEQDKRETEREEQAEETEPEDLRRRLEESEDRVEELEEELAEREERVEELESRVKRVQADFNNYKKRAEKRREEVRERATEDLVERLLDVRDDFERALEAEGEQKDLREGVEMILDELEGVLRDEGVERVDTEEFDPERHQAMMRVESEDHEEGEVVEVYEPGYRMAGRVVRPAKVTVAEAGDGDGDGDGSGNGDGEGKEDTEE
jgi:molecular chaperone GrpE